MERKLVSYLTLVRAFTNLLKYFFASNEQLQTTLPVEFPCNGIFVCQWQEQLLAFGDVPKSFLVAF